MKVTLLSCTPDAALLCGKASAVCTASDDPWRSLRAAMASGHTSVLEHAIFTFKVEGLSRAALAQLTRHRLASFDVESQRFCKLEDVKMVMPDSIARSEFLLEAEELLNKSMDLYKRMVSAGIPCEDARYVTTQAVETNLIVSMNARELRHFFSLRCCNRAQWEIRGVADAMLAICKRVAPELFYGAGPGCVSGNCPEASPCGRHRTEDEWLVLPEQAEVHV
ncbi:MAG: FAD-dependent thymidylate synthase [Eubacteriales bacterium]|nr:FAD-dependent thymidylate synthase [Eubacteriales bacterium]